MSLARQYSTNQKFKRMGTLDALPPMLLTALSVIEARHERRDTTLLSQPIG